MRPFDYFLRCVNLFALIGYMLSIISLLTSEWWNDCSKVNGAFHLISFVFLTSLEIQEPIPNMKYMQFMTAPFGRGLFYIWLAFITLNPSVLSIIGTTFTGSVGCCYGLFGILKACRGNRQPKVVLADSAPTSADYVVDIESEEPTRGESSTSPLLPGYTRTDPNKL
ncbi:unnamed protein product [Mucor hiemalis]